MGKFYRPYSNLLSALGEIVGNTRINTRNDHARVVMIEDNDDNDMYPDQQYKEKNMGYRVNTVMDPDGVFPGNDLDYDGLPDNEKNSNNIPDYYEPFLMYDVDPDEFIFGDDFNNNSITDYREDDIKYDTPYDLDRKGRHINLRYSPFKNVHLYLGSLHTERVGKDNITNNDYFKINFTYNISTLGNVFTEYRNERIHDNIQDPYVVSSINARYAAGVGGIYARYNNELLYDELEYRNSIVNKVFINSMIRCIPSITLENNLRFEKNDQIEGTMYDNTFQPQDNISTIAMVNKGTYTKSWRKFSFSPGMKFRLYKKVRSESISPLTYYLLRIPLVYLTYKVSDKTNLKFGAQGFKGMELLYKDYVIPKNDYRQTNYIFEIENNTSYFGFNVWGGLGYKLENIYFEKKYRSFEDYKSSSFFVQMWLGY